MSDCRQKGRERAWLTQETPARPDRYRYLRYLRRLSVHLVRDPRPLSIQKMCCTHRRWKSYASRGLLRRVVYYGMFACLKPVPARHLSVLTLLQVVRARKERV